jgi:AcrR family transcriptional regulator
MRTVVGRKKTEPILFERRVPTQARAHATIEAIFEATARIIERDGVAALNTNVIAERAGLSIGTLYEYFPNKEAVLIAMARRRLAQDERVIRQALHDAIDDPAAPLIRIAIRTLVALQRERPKVRRAIMAVHLASGLSSEHAKPVQEIAQLLWARSASIQRTTSFPLSRASLFVVTRAVIGVIRAAFEERSQLPGTRELEDELVRMVEGYLAQLPPLTG